MEAVFDQILAMSGKAAWVILAVLLARLLLRKAPKKYSFALWSAVAFRLLCPVSFSSAISLFNLSRQTQQTAVTAPTTAVVLPQLTAQTATAPTVVGSVPTVQAAAVNPAVIVWLIGAAVVLAAGLVSGLLLKRRLTGAVRLRENIWQSETVRSPFILGIVRPKIYIPYGLDETALSHVLAHERCHLRCFDHWIRPAAYGILALHWFNPLVWLAFVLMSRDMELRCDERVLAERVDGATYSETLLSFAVGRSFHGPAMLAFGESSVKTRIKHALGWKKPRVWLTTAALVLCIAVIAACAADPKPQEQPTAPQQEETDEPVEEEEPTVIAPAASEQAAFEASSVWVTRQCLYLPPYSSFLAAGGNSGRVYTLGGDTFLITDQNSGKVLQRTRKLDWSWREPEQDNILWTWLEDAGVQVTDRDGVRFMALTDAQFLLQADGALCIGEVDSELGLQSLYVLQPYGDPARCELYQYTEETNNWLLDLKYYEGAYDYKHTQAVSLHVSGDLTVRLQPTWPCETLQVLADHYGADGSNDLQKLTLEKQADGGFLLELDHKVTTQDEQLILRVPYEDGEYVVRIAFEALTRDPVEAAERELMALEDYAGHEILDHQTVVGCGAEESFESTTVYALTAHLLEDSSLYVWVPTKLTFYVDEEGCFLTGFWEPEEYKEYLPQIQLEFPEVDLDPEKTKLMHEKAVAARIDSLLTQMEAYGGIHSSLGVLLQDYADEYSELLSYGDATLSYVFTQFLQGGETGLKGRVMSKLLDDLTGDVMPLETDNGQEYFDEWFAYAKRLAEENGDAWLQANHPGAWLLLQLASE